MDDIIHSLSQTLFPFYQQGNQVSISHFPEGTHTAVRVEPGLGPGQVDLTLSPPAPLHFSNCCVAQDRILNRHTTPEITAFFPLPSQTHLYPKISSACWDL